MLIKLLKHDFISLFKKISGVWLIFGAAFAFQFLLADLLEGAGKASSTPGVGNGVIMFFVVAGFAFSGFAISGTWFSNKMYGNEGYLTNTLPAKTWQIVLSKFIIAALVTMISAFFSLVSLGIMASRIIEGFQGIWNVFVALLGSAWKELFRDWFIRAALDFFFSTFNFLALCLFSTSLSNAIDFGNKTVKTVIFILLGAVATQMIGSLFIADQGNPFIFSAMSSKATMPEVFNTNVFLNWAYTGLLSLIYFFGTLYISEKHLKLRD